MWKIISILKENLIWSIPAFMVAGVIVGGLTNPQPLQSLVAPLTFLMVYPMMIDLKVQDIFSGEDLKVQWVTQFINFAIVPFFAYGLGYVFFSDRPFVWLGLLLAALLPTSGMSISWTGFAKGNVSAAVKMKVVGTILGSIAAPLYIQLLMGTTIDIQMAAIFRQISIFVFLPMVLGIVTRIILIQQVGLDKYNASLKPKFPSFSTLGVLGIVFVTMALKAEDIIADPLLLLSFLVPLAILYLGNFVLSTIVGKVMFERGDAIALVYSTVMRNLSIALAMALTVFGGDEGAEIAIIIALAYIIQVQSAAWYVKFTDRIFGPSLAVLSK